jgi:hypothetical protein
MNAYGGVDVQIHIFLTSALAGGERSTSRPGRFTPEERAPGTDCIRGWVDSRAGLDDAEKRKILDPTGTRTPTPRSSNPTTLSRLLILISKLRNILIAQRQFLTHCIHRARRAITLRHCRRDRKGGREGGRKGEGGESRKWWVWIIINNGK